MVSVLSPIQAFLIGDVPVQSIAECYFVIISTQRSDGLDAIVSVESALDDTLPQQTRSNFITLSYITISEHPKTPLVPTEARIAFRYGILFRFCTISNVDEPNATFLSYSTTMACKERAMHQQKCFAKLRLPQRLLFAMAETLLRRDVTPIGDIRA